MLRRLGLRYIVLLATTAFLPAYAVACSDDDPGAVPRASSSDSGPVPTTDAADSSPPAGDPCAEIASACHPYDLGAGKTHECRELAEDPDSAAKCATERTACLAACSAGAGPIDVTLRFAAFVGAMPFACGTKYPDLGSEASMSEPIDLRFYVTDVKLIDEAGSDVPVSLTPDGAFQSGDVALIDFENKAGACDNGTPQTNDTVRGKVPFGKYKGVAFTIGVPEALNHTDVATAPTPLNLTGLNWSWQMGRIFFASGMRADIGDAGATNDSFVHIGSTGCTGDPADGGTATCAKSNRATFRFAAFRPAANTLALDMRELMKDQKLASVMHGCHSFSAETCSKAFEHFGLEFATGQATTAQTVFSVK